MFIVVSTSKQSLSFYYYLLIILLLICITTGNLLLLAPGFRRDFRSQELNLPSTFHISTLPQFQFFIKPVSGKWGPRITSLNENLRNCTPSVPNATKETSIVNCLKTRQRKRLVQLSSVFYTNTLISWTLVSMF